MFLNKNLFNTVISEWVTYLLLCAESLSHVRLFATPWTVAHQALLSMGILQARILEWVAMPSSRGSSDPRIEPKSPELQADSLPSEPPEKPTVIVRILINIQVFHYGDKVGLYFPAH